MGVKGTLEEAMLGTHIVVRTVNQKVSDVYTRRTTERAGLRDDRPRWPEVHAQTQELVVPQEELVRLLLEVALGVRLALAPSVRMASVHGDVVIKEGTERDDDGERRRGPEHQHLTMQGLERRVEEGGVAGAHGQADAQGTATQLRIRPV